MTLPMFQPFKIGNITLKNRIGRSATWMGMSVNAELNESLVSTYGELAQNGIGLLVTGFTSISPYDELLAGGVRFVADSQIESHKKLTDAAHAYGSAIYLQAAMIDSFVARGMQKDINYLSEAEISGFVRLFAQAATHCEQAGYDGMQIHAAHFFLLSRFISPAVNRRKDGYGGSVANRARILTDIIAASRAETSSGFSLIIKINCSDFVPGGLNLNDFLETSEILSQAGIDAIEISGNNTSRQGIRPGENEAYFLDAGQALRQKVTTPILLVGGLRSPDVINSLISRNCMDIAMLSRPLIREPALASRWLTGDLSPAKCISCNACYRTDGHQCIYNRGGRD